MEPNSVLTRAFSILLLSTLIPSSSSADILGGKRSTSQAEKLSFHKEALSDIDDEIEELEERRKYYTEQLSIIRRMESGDSVDYDDPGTIDYTRDCFCGPPKCDSSDYNNLGVPYPSIGAEEREYRKDQKYVDSRRSGAVDVDPNGKGPNGQGPNAQGGGSVTVITNVSTSVREIDRFFQNEDGSPITESQHEKLCMDLYDAWRGKGISSSCKRAMLSCGAVAMRHNESIYSREIKQIEKDIADAKARKKKAIAEKEKMLELYGQCPSCYMAIMQEDRGAGRFGTTLSNIMPYVRDMFVSGMGTLMYNKSLRTQLSMYNRGMDAYNSYLSNSYQAYAQYIGLYRDLGIPAEQYRGALPFGMYGGMMGGGMMGMPGGMFGGGMMGFPGGMMGGAYMGGMYGGGMMGMPGGMYGGSMMGGSIIGGMYGGIIGGGGMGIPGAMMGGAFGMPGGMYGTISGGFAGGMYGMPGMMSGGFAGGMYGMPGTMVGGFSGGMYGMPGTMVGGYSGGMFGMPGTIAGGFAGGMYGAIAGGFNGGMYGGMMGGGMMGADAIYQLQMQRQMLYQQNSMIAQQQMMEAQYRYQNIASGMYYGMGMPNYIGGGALGYLNIGLGAYPYMSYPGTQGGAVPPLATPPFNPYTAPATF